jgi:hypothetical protein
MSLSVNILATCRKPELLRATTLVFDTLRTGFPNAYVTVFWNGASDPSQREHVFDAAKKAGVQSFADIEPITHHEFVRRRIESTSHEWVLADTDIALWENIEDWKFDAPIAGRLIPQFTCRFANAITRPRLHTALMFIDPVKVQSLFEQYAIQFPNQYCTPRPYLQDLVYPKYVPQRMGSIVRNYFHDTTCLLYAAIGGQAFTDEQNKAWDHLGSGTLSDVVGPSYPGLQQSHAAVLEEPSLLKGAWKKEQQFYAAMQ